MTAPNKQQSKHNKSIGVPRVTKKLKPSYVTDANGKTTGVLLTLKDWDYIAQQLSVTNQTQALPPAPIRTTTKSLMDLAGIMDSRLPRPPRDKLTDARERPEDEAARLDRQ